MGPNGSGKSTLSAIIAGKEIKVDEGSNFQGEDLLGLAPEERAPRVFFPSNTY